MGNSDDKHFAMVERLPKHILDKCEEVALKPYERIRELESQLKQSEEKLENAKLIIRTKDAEIKFLSNNLQKIATMIRDYYLDEDYGGFKDFLDELGKLGIIVDGKRKKNIFE